MPFINKFYQKKTPRRKNVTANALREKPDDSIALDLGNIKANFENGQWILQLSFWDQINRENVFLKRQMSQLAESSNLLKLKNDVLLDMLTREFLPLHGFGATAEDNFFCCDLKGEPED